MHLMDIITQAVVHEVGHRVDERYEMGTAIINDQHIRLFADGQRTNLVFQAKGTSTVDGRHFQNIRSPQSKLFFFAHASDDQRQAHHLDHVRGHVIGTQPNRNALLAHCLDGVAVTIESLA